MILTIHILHSGISKLNKDKIIIQVIGNYGQLRRKEDVLLTQLTPRLILLRDTLRTSATAYLIHPYHKSILLFPDMMMSKSKNNELKFSIQNLIDTKTTPPSSEKKDKGITNSTTNRSLKRIVIESESSSTLLPRPIPLLKPKMLHPCWSFLSPTTNKNASNGNIPFNSSLIFLNKMNQVWQQIQRSQISPSITTTASSTTENDDVSDEDIYMDTSLSSIRRHNELDDDDDEVDDEEEEEDEEEEGECSTSTGDKHNTILNSEENDKLKNYPCTQCGKVKILNLLFASNPCSSL